MTNTTASNHHVRDHGRLRQALAFGAGITATLMAGIVFSAIDAGAALEAGESTFVPIEPCRLFDTRPGTDNVGERSSPIGSAETHTVQVTGTNGECTIPAGASAVALNATALDATAASFGTFFPSGTVRPLSSNLNYVPGQPPTPNKVDVKLSGDGSIDIYNHAGSVDLLADITGYYRDSGIAELDASQPIAFSASSDFEDALSSDDTVVLTIAGNAPVDGQVIADYSAMAFANVAGDDIMCGLTDGDEIELRFQQTFESPGLDGNAGVLSASRAFDVAAGPFEINLVCRKTGTASGIDRHHMTGIFIAD